MSREPMHDNLQQMLPAAALGVLDEAERRQVLTHVQHCGDCARQLQEYRQTAAQLALLLPERIMEPTRSARLRDRLARRVRRDAERDPSTSSAGVQQPRRPSVLEGRWAGWAVAAGLTGVLLLHHAVHRPLDYGWLLAGGLILVLIALGVYASIQRGRVAMLKKQLAQIEQRVDSGRRE